MISTADRERLERLVRGHNTPQKVVWRTRIVLADDGLTAVAIAAVAGKSVLMVRRWHRRYLAKGVTIYEHVKVPSVIHFYSAWPMQSYPPALTWSHKIYRSAH